MDLPSNIILIGFMGSGKTTTGKELAQKLGFTFLDSDQFIEDECGMKIPEIFKIHGESYFRKKERELIESLMPKRNHVISTGGGLWLERENRQKLMSLGICVWLKVSADKAFSRIGANPAQRPLLASSGDPIQIIGELITQREGEYSKAHVMVDTDDKNPKQVVLEIVELLKKDRPFDLRSMQK